AELVAAAVRLVLQRARRARLTGRRRRRDRAQVDLPEAGEIRLAVGRFRRGRVAVQRAVGVARNVRRRVRRPLRARGRSGSCQRDHEQGRLETNRHSVFAMGSIDGVKNTVFAGSLKANPSYLKNRGHGRMNAENATLRTTRPHRRSRSGELLVQIDPRDVISKSPMSAMQVLIIAITVGLNGLDGFDVLSISYASPGIRAQWGIDQGVLGL